VPLQLLKQPTPYFSDVFIAVHDTPPHQRLGAAAVPGGSAAHPNYAQRSPASALNAEI